MQVLDNYMAKGNAAKGARRALSHSHTLTSDRRVAEDAIRQALRLRDQGLGKLGITPGDLEHLNKVPLLTSIVGLVVNIVLLMSMGSYAWMHGTALQEGQPFKAQISLLSAKFGDPADLAKDNGYFCDAGSRYCDLSALCAAAAHTDTFPNGLPKYTPSSVWCTAAEAGSSALGLLWLGLIPGLAATGFTGLYAAKEIAPVGAIVGRAEAMGVSDKAQRMLIAGCWAALWVFMFFAMTTYASMIPDTLGWGVTTLDSSFGMLRFVFVLVSIFGMLLVSSLFKLWNADNVVEAWMEFSEARLFSAKKALYLELMLQLALYFFMVVYVVDWSALLIVLAGFYLDAKNKNFMLMYLVLVSISILFDVIHAASLPSFANMSTGQSFGETMWVGVLILKFLILGTIYLYEKYEKEGDYGAGGGFSKFDEVGVRDDEIAE